MNPRVMSHDDFLDTAVPTTADAAALAALKADTFTETFAHNNDPNALAAHVTDAFTVDRMVAELTNPACVTMWVLDADAPVGYLKMNLPPNNAEPELADGLEVEQIYFRRSHQGRGLGRRLIEYAVREARMRGVPFVWLGVWEHNTGAIGFYERLGFRTCGEHTFYLGDEAQRDFLMRLDFGVGH